MVYAPPNLCPSSLHQFREIVSFSVEFGAECQIGLLYSVNLLQDRQMLGSEHTAECVRIPEGGLPHSKSTWQYFCLSPESALLG